MLVHQRVSGKGNLQQLPGYPISWSSIFPGFLSATPSHCFTGFWHMANGRRLTIFQVMLFLANKIVLMGRACFQYHRRGLAAALILPAWTSGTAESCADFRIFVWHGGHHDLKTPLLLVLWNFFYDFPFTLGMSSYVIIFFSIQLGIIWIIIQ